MTNLAHRNLNIISQFEFSGIIILPCVLWRHGILAAKPLLREGTNLQVNSLWEKGLNADDVGDVMTNTRSGDR